MHPIPSRYLYLFPQIDYVDAYSSDEMRAEKMITVEKWRSAFN